MSTEQNTRVLITGASGFIGSNLVDYFSSKFSKNSFSTSRSMLWLLNHVNCNLTHPEDVKKMLDQVKPNVIIHCAAVPTTKYNDKSLDQLKNNIECTYNLLSNLKDCHFINISTVLVYKDFNTKELGPKTIYGTSKLCCENLCKNFSTINNIKYTNLRIPATIGPRLSHGVIKDIIRKINESSEITLFGKEPGSKKPFLHISDLCTALMDIITEKKYGDFDLSPEDNLSVLEIAEIVSELLNKKIQINWSNETWPGDDNVISIKPKIPTSLNSRQAVIETVKYYISATLRGSSANKIIYADREE